MTTAQTALYAYAFVDAGAGVPDGLVGLGPRQAPVRLLDRDGLGVLVSDVDAARLSTILDDEDVTEQSELAVRAREHDWVVRSVSERGPVLPFRFGTVLRDANAADRLLATQHDTATALLRHVDGRHEWAVRLHAQAPNGDESAVDRSSGKSYLADRGRRLRDLDEQQARQRDAADAVRDDLASWAADTVDRRSGRALLDLAVLVDRTAEDDFLEHVGQLAVKVADAGLLLDTAGPWPAYSFTGAVAEVSHD